MDQSLRFALAILAVWRLTHLLAREDGPWDLFRTLRARTAAIAGRLMSCFYCLSVWIALPFGWFVGRTLLEQLISWWAVSGAAVLLERATAERMEMSIEEDTGELLRPGDRARDD